MRLPLKPKPGLFSDDTTFASPGVWEDASNIRFWLGSWQTIGGWGKAFPTNLTGVCRALLPWTQVDGQMIVAFGTHSALQVYSNGLLSDITPAGLTVGNENTSGGSPGWGSGAWGTGTWSSAASDYYARTWSLATYGEQLIANPRGKGIYRWENDPLFPAVIIPNAPTVVDGILVTSEAQILAFGCNEEVSGNYNPLAIRGSDIRDPEMWTTAANNNAFEHILEGGGRIVGWKQIGSYIAVWTNSALHLGQFIGEAGQAYRFDRVAENCGLVAPNAVEVVNQTAFWIGPDYQFRAWQLGGEPAILKCPIWRDFTDNLVEAQKEKIVATGVSKFGEVWFHYPDDRDGIENSRYVAFNIADGTWFKGIMARSAAVDAGIATHPIMVEPSGGVYYHEYGETANGGALPWFIRSSDQYMDDGGRAVLIRGVRPDFEDQSGDIDLTFYVRRFPQGVAVEKGPYTLPNDREKKDLRVQGHIIASEFSGTEYARYGRPIFDLVPTGARA